jgi:phage terminase large subunit-like protein
MAKQALDQIRQAAENDLEFFIQLVAPQQLLGDCHKEVIEWWTRQDARNYQLLLFPRDHGKSRLIAYRVAWELTKDPTLRVLYISATANLAEKQLSFIKGILTSEIYRRYWPEHVNQEEGKRSRWTNSEISLDHPLRKEENVRDPSIFTGGLTTSLTGLHCDIAVLDDVVVAENALTSEGRSKVASQYSLLSSIEGADAREWVVGTRYHSKDLYNDLMEMKEVLYDDEGEQTGEDNIYEILEKPVEDQGDGTGQFLWPKQQRKDGKWFGFDIATLAKKRGKYLDKGQFKAQYYNDPSDPDNVPVSRDKIQYFDRKHLRLDNGHWHYKDSKLNLFGAIDFAFSLRSKADYTALVLIGVDSDNNVYVLDIDRFRTDRISEYFDHIFELHSKWSFRKLRAEVTVAQMAIVKQLKELIKQHGLALSIDEFRPNKQQGNKQERIASVLEPRYDNLQMWHYRGGNTQYLEDELSTRNPPHDDVIDALASAVDMAVRPTRNLNRKRENNIVWANSRFRAGSR